MNKKFWMAGFLVIPKVYAVIASPFRAATLGQHKTPDCFCFNQWQYNSAVEISELCFDWLKDKDNAIIFVTL